MGEMVVLDQLNWGYLQLGVFALVFGGLQIWWVWGWMLSWGEWWIAAVDEHKKQYNR